MHKPRVPLTRPLFPRSSDFAARWAHVTGMSGQHTNGGLLWQEAARRIEHFVGGYYAAFPVSNGTDAVALAIHAAAADKGSVPPAVFVEAFTFAATTWAARMVVGDGVELVETDEEVEPESIVVRTKWWGYDRDLSASTANTVIDAAGGFGDRSAFAKIGRDSIVAVSFHATKNFPIGEGGAVLVPRHRDRAQLAVRRAMNFGFDEHREISETFGMNGKLDELRCSLLIEQLDNARLFSQRGDSIREIAETLKNILRMNGGLVEGSPHPGFWPSLPVVPVRDPRALVAFLGDFGFQCRITYDWQPGVDYLPWQRSCVAFPADMTGEEFRELAGLLDGFYLKGGGDAV